MISFRKNLVWIIVLSIAVFSTLTACGKTESSVNQTTENQKSTGTFKVFLVNDYFNAFKKAGLPIGKSTIFTAESDPNKLLGRPNQYVGKVNWEDTRIKQEGDDFEGGSIETFSNEQDLNSRKQYVEAISKSGGMFAQYNYAHKNALLRLSKELTPTQVEEYKKVFDKL